MATRPRGQTIVTQLGNRTTVAPAPQRSRSVASTPTSAAVRDPRSLVRLMAEDKRRISELEAKALSDVFGSGVLLRNIAGAANPTITYIQHRLGRPYTGYFVTRVQGNNLSNQAIERPLPSNMSSSVWLALLFLSANTYDLWVF